MHHRRIALVIACLLAASLPPFARAYDEPIPAPQSMASVYEFHHDNVLGTQLELRIVAGSEQAATVAEQQVLKEIDRLNEVLSVYRPDSELSVWLKNGTSSAVSDDLRSVLKASEHWQKQSSGAFHPGVEMMSQLWRAAEASQSMPDQKELAQAAETIRSAPWTWSPGGRVQPTGYAVTFNALAKGYIIDQACERAMKTFGVEFVSVNIGGDLRVAGSRSQRVVVRTENRMGEDEVVDVIQLKHLSIATSGPQFRGFEIQGTHYSHLINPATGMPVHHIRSASVVADTAMTADALATACSVLSVEESLKLIESTPHAACLLLSEDGETHESSRWKTLRSASESMDYQWTSALDEKDATNAEKKVGPWNGGMEMQVDLEIVQPSSGGRYRRPYVACWIEDAKGFPVRTILLWVQATAPGPKWIPDLRRWYKSDRLRSLAEETNLIETVSEATRKPGKYTVIWDGTDDNGRLTPPGKYTFFIESAREHGTYQLIRKEITLGDKAFEENFDDNVELKNAHIQYRKTK
ncbi:MAG: DUF2271 domain-containing protein [Planctomycetota bacterium]